MDNTAKFTGRAQVYAASRPGYAPEFFDYMEQSLNLPSGSVIADIGSGTGKFTAQLLERGYTVYAVEPNADMRRKAEELLAGNPGFHSVDGRDSAFGLPAELEGTVDCVTAAQAFHWFDAAAFAEECRRFLKPCGYVVLVYNHRDADVPVIRENAEICRTYCPGFTGFSHGMDAADFEGFFRGSCQTIRFDNSLEYDCDMLINRMLSASYGLKDTDEGYGEFLAALRKLFEKYQENGRMRIPNCTAAYYGTVVG